MSSARILIVDDERPLAEMMADVMADAGFSPRIVDSGRAALAAIAQDRPDLILLDVHMPEEDGFAVASTLKNDPQTATIPIIMLSAQAGRGARVIGLESGAEDYLTKPADTAELLAKIRNLLRLQSRTVLEAEQARD